LPSNSRWSLSVRLGGTSPEKSEPSATAARRVRGQGAREGRRQPSERSARKFVRSAKRSNQSSRSTPCKREARPRSCDHLGLARLTRISSSERTGHVRLEECFDIVAFGEYRLLDEVTAKTVHRSFSYGRQQTFARARSIHLAKNMLVASLLRSTGITLPQCGFSIVPGDDALIR